MRHITCRACGKAYDYDIDGCCPHCGAYNRPPRRVRVEADGQLHAATGDKVCYERKECYEGQTRHRGKVSFSSLKRAEEKHPLDFTAVRSSVKTAYKKGKSANKKSQNTVVVGIILAVILALLPRILDSCADRAYSHDNTDVEYNNTADLYFPDDGNQWYEMDWGDTFTWHGEDTCLVNAEYVDSKSIMVTVSTNVSPDTDVPYVAVDGYLNTRCAPAKSTQADGECTYQFLLSNDGSISTDFEGRTDIIFAETDTHTTYVVNIW